MRRALDGTFAALWRGMMRLTRPRSAVTEWSATGDRRVIVIAPHPDDEVAGCGGVMLRHRAKGDRVSVLYATDGSGSRAFRGMAPAEIAKKRAAEAEAARGVLGIVRHRWVGLREWHWGEGNLARQLEQFIGDEDPGVIYAPSRVDFHPEHIKVARVLARILGNPAHRQRVVRIYQVQVPLTSILVNLVAAVGDELPVVKQAMETYGSQEGSLRATLRLKGYTATRYRVPVAAEGFWELDAAEYSALHRPLADESFPTDFRALRRLAISDPLAFLQGRDARRHLLSLARA